MVLTEGTVLTALDQFAQEQMDLMMVQPELHAPLKSQLLSHTITLIHSPEDHMLLPVIHSQQIQETFQELPIQTLTSEDNPSLNNNGSQSLSSQLNHFQNAMAPMEEMVLTVQDQSAQEQMDHTMAQQELHVLLKSQLPSHITILTHSLEDHMPLPVILFLPTQEIFQEPPIQTPTLEDNPSLKPPQDIQNQKRSLLLTQRLPEPTLLSTTKTERKWRIICIETYRQSQCI